MHLRNYQAKQATMAPQHTTHVDNERSTHTHSDKKNRPLVDRQAPPKLDKKAEHESAEMFLGKKRQNRRARRAAAREERRAEAAASAAAAAAGTQTTKADDAGDGETVKGARDQTAVPSGPGPAMKDVGAQADAATQADSKTESPRSVKVARSDRSGYKRGARSRCPSPRDNVNSNQPTNKQSGYQSCVSPHLPRDKRSDHDSSASAAVLVSSETNASNIVTLAELLQWLKLLETDKQARLPGFGIDVTPFVCMRARTNHGPQPQEYRRAQAGRQRTLGSLERILRPIAGSRTPTADHTAEDRATRELPNQGPTEQTRATTQSSEANGNGPSNASKRKGKRSSASQSPSFERPMELKKSPSRSSSLEITVVAAADLPSPARRNAISVASPRDTSLSMASNIAADITDNHSSSTQNFLSHLQDDRWIHDVTAPLPDSTSPTTCMMVGHSGGPDLKHRTLHKTGITLVKKKSKKATKEMLEEEKHRNAAAEQEESKAYRKAYRKLQKQKAQEMKERREGKKARDEVDGSEGCNA